MARKLEGKIAVVTGGPTRIGLATARRFATEGARVLASNVRIKGTPAFSVYSAPKAAVRKFARRWTLDPEVSRHPRERHQLRADQDARPRRLGQSRRRTAAGPTRPYGLDRDPEVVAVFLAPSDPNFIAATERFVDGGQARI